MAPTPRILLLGGHGKVSLLMTPKLVSRSWNVTSVIRNPDQKAEILEAGKKGPGKVDVLVESIEDVKSEGDAKRILDLVKPDWVIWSAGLSPSLIPFQYMRRSRIEFDMSASIWLMSLVTNRCGRKRWPISN